MHDTAYEHGRLFFDLYWNAGFTAIADLGSQDVNGSLRDHCPAGARYIGLDMAPGRGVDVVVSPGAALPLADASVDVVVTSSAFEHDYCFWDTFLELLRILKPGGLLYVNAPSNGAFHRYPVDCWRFYPDAGVALVSWAQRRGVAVELVESFVAERGADGWADFVAVFRRPSPQPLVRRGRIADHARAVNIQDAAGLEAERAETPEMAEVAALRERLDAADAEAAELRAELAAANARVAALRASTSWRVTGPLRRFATLLKGQGN